MDCRMFVFILVFYQAIVFQDHYVSSEIQQFALPPTNKEVVAGQDITMHCQVSNKAGSVQWSKNSIMLGFDPQIPGFPRYSIKGNSTLGIYDLKIENASLEDDADFECQVGPAAGQEALVAKAHLTVLLPPISIQIVGKPNGTVVKLKMSESLSLECEVKGGKPAPKVFWYRDSLKLPEESIATSVKDEADKRQVIIATLKINPTSDDNNVYYHCETMSPFLSKQLTAGVGLNVLYIPGRPSIDGYRLKDKIRAGDTVNLKCSSRGGNPLARLVWTKNGDFVDHSYTSSTSDWETMNEISFVAAPSDDGAVYTCSASSIMTSEPMQKSVSLKVLYAPSSVSIKAPKEAKSGDVISATCKTERSNPAAEITWVVDGLPLIGLNSVAADEKGGWITTSSISVNVTQQDRNLKLFTCYAVNQELGETIPQTFSVSILYAPDAPNIFGYVEGTAIQAGKLQRLTCISHGGHPLPDLKWYKNAKEVTSSAQTTSGNIISRELVIIIEADDNRAQYQCKSTSKALVEPLVASVNLTVYFPPMNLQLKVKPKKPKAGSEIRLMCESASSNPAANITWWKGKKNELELTPVSVSVSSSGDKGGFVTKAAVLMNVTAEDDGSMCTCQATNEAIQQSVHDTLILAVFYKPVFSISDTKTFEVKENDSCIIDMTAKSNPSKVTYEWKKGGEVVEEGPIFNITSVERSQSGEYTCKAVNEIGEASITVVLKVLYPAVILKNEGEKDEKVIIAEPESNVRLMCSADGYPLKEDTLQWKRDNFDMKGRTEVLSRGNGKSILGVKNVSREYSGEFLCVANNGIGSADTWKIVLLVKHEPVIISTDNDTVSSDRGISTRMYCTAVGIPDVSFSWTFEGVIISAGKTARIKNDVVKLDYITWQSVLTIDDVNAKDFGEYKCVARNEIGFETIGVTLLPDSAPDPPIIVRVLNTTKNSLLVSWVPGFDGGHNQTHRIRFKDVMEPAFKYIDVHPPATNSVWVSGLKARVEYEVAMKSINEKGASRYTTAIVKAVTLDPFHGLSKNSKNGIDLGVTLVELLVGTIGTVFFLLLAFNIILLALYCHKKDHKIRRKYSDGDISISSDISHSSKVESNETTFSSFTDYSSDTLRDKTTLSDTISEQYSDSKSEDSNSSVDEIATSYSESPSINYYTPRQGVSEFI